MAGEDALRRLLAIQRRRLIATFLGYAELKVYPHLSHDQRNDLRGEFLDAIGAYHELMLDIVAANDEANVTINPEAMALLRDIRAQLNSHSRQQPQATEQV